VLNPSFARGRVDNIYVPKIRALTIELVEQLKPRAACEFVSEFASVMPVSIFLGVVELPVERREEFISWGRGLFQKETRSYYIEKVTSFLAEVIRERAESSGDDLLSRIAKWRSNGHFKSEEEIIGMAMLVFAGGLDTVAAELSFAMWHLARRPELQRRLREDRAIIPMAVEEFLRRHGLSNTARLVLKECEREGAHLMPGDLVMVPVALSGIDDHSCENPLDIDFDRKPVPHNTFGNGPHKCVGAYLARAEFRVFLEEWFTRMPNVRLDANLPPVSHAGSVEGMSRLNLVWDV
jgi:cytochrome P450